ncbi:hypothetical protein IGI04_030014 [Brassica rapa subsp. trilocularis]|uniref:At2g35280-like TPR domain-containing protein n=1 Tax=Brassica rapa subsp. trilocularis TaxID=1813537 RepID=A0ABQ7LPG3_BRACM|nr:hypothetical protein IGI04_030014 [Brassica rapa subsp. trilocularis]
MKALAERRGVCHFLDVLSVPWGLNMPSELLKACYGEGNPSTLYIKGVQFFYSLDLHEEGLSLMKRAADAGYERAVYTHAMTRAIFEGEGKYFDGILFESVDRIGKLVRSVKWAWGLWHGDYFRDHKVLFICFLCHRSTDANVQILCSDNVTACGTLMSLRMITCVTAVSGSKSSACSYVILNR